MKTGRNRACRNNGFPTAACGPIMKSSMEEGMDFSVKKIALLPPAAIVLLLLSLISIACKGKAERKTDHLPYYNSPDFTPQWVNSPKLASELIPHTVGEFSLTDQEGRPFTDRQVKGKIHIASFFFTSCPGICPQITHNLQSVCETFTGDSGIVFLSYSVMPWADSVPKLRQYALRENINNRQWHLLTGHQGDIYTLARQSYFAEDTIGYNRDSSEFLHTEHVLLVDPTLRLRGVYNGTVELEMQRLTDDIRLLIRETRH